MADYVQLQDKNPSIKRFSIPERGIPERFLIFNLYATEYVNKVVFTNFLIPTVCRLSKFHYL